MVLAYIQSQNEDGSWGQTVSGTALVLEKLFELGMPREDSHLLQAAKWLLDHFQMSIKRKRPNSSLEITVRNIFTTANYGAEHAAASKILFHQKLTSGCFQVIPLIQTALTLRVLVRMGYEKDERVDMAFRSLLDMQAKTNEPNLELPVVPMGCWCAHKCRFKLEERIKANKPLHPTPNNDALLPK